MAGGAKKKQRKQDISIKIDGEPDEIPTEIFEIAPQLEKQNDPLVIFETTPIMKS